MRLGKEQSAGYVEDIETGVVEAPLTVVASSAAEAPEAVPTAHEPVTVTR